MEKEKNKGLDVDKNEKSLAKEIGAEIARRRKLMGYTQVQMSKLLGIEQESLSRIEKGIIAPKFSRLESLANVLECKVSDLFLGTSDDYDNISAIIADNVAKLPKNQQVLALDIMKNIVFTLKKHL